MLLKNVAITRILRKIFSFRYCLEEVPCMVVYESLSFNLILTKSCPLWGLPVVQCFQSYFIFSLSGPHIICPATTFPYPSLADLPTAVVQLTSVKFQNCTVKLPD
jgi:hypothetical protein